MDLMTLLGLIGALSILVGSVARDGALSTFFNLHGILIVTGGTLCATMINSSLSEMKGAVRAGVSLFFQPKHLPPNEIIGQVVRIAAKARQLGVSSIEEEGKDIRDDGFFAHAIEVALTSGDERLARVTLEKEINQIRIRHREVGNVFRTSGLLSPMFGLLGTLIGIISVLRNISEPESVGPAMAVAISSAFYGILIANLIFVPGAGKLRTRSLEELLSKEMILEGLMDIVYSDKIPLVIQMRLLSYLQTGKNPVGDKVSQGSVQPAS